MCAMLCCLSAVDLLVYYRVTDRHGRGLHMVKKEREWKNDSQLNQKCWHPDLELTLWKLSHGCFQHLFIHPFPTIILMWMCSIYLSRTSFETPTPTDNHHHHHHHHHHPPHHYHHHHHHHHHHQKASSPRQEEVAHKYTKEHIYSVIIFI